MITRVRNSALRQRRTCAFAYKRTYIDGDPGLPSPSLQAGQRIHTAVAELIRRVVAGDPIIDVHDIAFRVVRGGDVEYADALRLLTRVQEALGTEFDVDPRGAFLLEKELEMPIRLWDGSEMVFFGTPDLVERTGKKACRITDWKSHWHPMTKEQCDADPQLRRYALLVKHHYPAFERFELVRRFIRYRDNHHEEVITAEALPRVRDALASEIQAARELDAAGEFEPTGGAWCALCQHHASCPLIARYREQGVADWLEISDDDDARAMAGDVMALQAARERLRTHLARYLGDPHPTGAVPVAGGAFGYHATDHQEIGVPALRETLDGQGVELSDDVLRVDLTALEVLKKKLPESVVRAVEKATRRYQGTRLQFKRHDTEAAHETTPAYAAENAELFT